jgi:16S rRNA (guanine966-N2)-methyltransferase
VRIIGGTLRGKKLLAPDSLPVRPTTDFAKTGLFNILSVQFNFNECTVLDLYAGTGSITYEFLSRGCTKIECVDRHAACIKYIKETIEKLKFEGDIKVTLADAFTYLGKNNHQFDIIFADPPFADEITEGLAQIVFRAGKLKDGGMLIIEHITGKDYQDLNHFIETRKYGNVSFSFFGDRMRK